MPVIQVNITKRELALLKKWAREGHKANTPEKLAQKLLVTQIENMQETTRILERIGEALSNPATRKGGSARQQT